MGASSRTGGAPLGGRWSRPSAMPDEGAGLGCPKPERRAPAGSSHGPSSPSCGASVAPRHRSCLYYSRKERPQTAEQGTYSSLLDPFLLALHLAAGGSVFALQPTKTLLTGPWGALPAFPPWLPPFRLWAPSQEHHAERGEAQPEQPLARIAHHRHQGSGERDLPEDHHEKAHKQAPARHTRKSAGPDRLHAKQERPHDGQWPIDLIPITFR
jgi:hypothetical protein